MHFMEAYTSGHQQERADAANVIPLFLQGIDFFTLYESSLYFMKPTSGVVRVAVYFLPRGSPQRNLDHRLRNLQAYALLQPV